MAVHQIKVSEALQAKMAEIAAAAQAGSDAAAAVASGPTGLAAAEGEAAEASIVAKQVQEPPLVLQLQISAGILDMGAEQVHAHLGPLDKVE